MDSRRELTHRTGMKQRDKRQQVNSPSGTRRIVVLDSSLEASQDVRGRRLQSPPKTEAVGPSETMRPIKFPPIGRSYLLAGLGAGMVLLTVFAFLILRKPGKEEPNVRTPEPQATVQASVKEAGVSLQVEPQTQSEELRRIEEDAKQVIRRISRDNKPYSFSEDAVIDIQARVRELSRSPFVSGSLLKLQANTAAIGSKAEKEGLQPSLVILVSLAVTKGGQGGDSLIAAARAVPLLASLNKMFGSNEADSCLILIAAFHEGAGTHRSHPLLRRMQRVVNNPLTERNVWYLHDQDVLASDAYDLVVDTIAYGVIARNPRQFGLDNDPLSL